MTRVFLDTNLPERLREAGEALQVCDDSGRTIGMYYPAAETESETQSPFSREETERRRLQRAGEPLDVVLRKLEALAAGEKA